MTKNKGGILGLLNANQTAISAILAIVTLLNLVGAVYYTAQSAPLKQDLALHTQKIEALDKTADERTSVISIVPVLQEQVLGIKQDIREIKESNLRIEQKLDRIAGR